MKAVAELQVVPIGSGVSVRQEISRVVEILRGYEFIMESHASGTNIEGELADILAAVAQVHEILHQEGSIRLVSYLKLETRTDKIPTLIGKRLASK
ncbi:MTH1187 family thiamine-binding protein [Kaarinaea lacus]